MLPSFSFDRMVLQQRWLLWEPHICLYAAPLPYMQSFPLCSESAWDAQNLQAQLHCSMGFWALDCPLRHKGQKSWLI